MSKSDKERQRAYKQRMRDIGYRQFAFWLDSEAQAALNDLKPMWDDLSTVVSIAIKHYHTSKTRNPVTSNTKSVSSDMTRDNRAVSRNVTKNATSNRCMRPELEDCILELRQGGMTLKDISSNLAREGYLNANGKPYNTSTISKAEMRAKRRSGQG